MTGLSFKHCQFDKAIILMAIRWYCAYRLGYRDIEELLAERGVYVDQREKPVKSEAAARRQYENVV